MRIKMYIQTEKAIRRTCRTWAAVTGSDATVLRRINAALAKRVYCLAAVSGWPSPLLLQDPLPAALSWLMARRESPYSTWTSRRWGYPFGSPSSSRFGARTPRAMRRRRRKRAAPGTLTRRVPVPEGRAAAIPLLTRSWMIRSSRRTRAWHPLSSFASNRQPDLAVGASNWSVIHILFLHQRAWHFFCAEWPGFWCP